MENNLATYNHPSEFQVWVTNDYGLFKNLNGNRDIAFARVDKIAKSIKNIGYRPQPILVNGNMEIIDGQGRFQALKNMGLPILYIIDKNAGIKECISMNIYQEKWNVMDYVKSYAEQGNNDYILLYEMIKQAVIFNGLAQQDEVTDDDVFRYNVVVNEVYGRMK